MDERQEDDWPRINIPLLQRDAYFLLALLLADEKIAQSDILPDTVEQHFESSINQLLIWLAVTSRLMLELSKSDIEDCKCGEYWINPNSQALELSFHKACSTIIHATEIVPYNKNTTASKKLGAAREFYRGELTIEGKNGKRKQTIVLDGQSYRVCYNVVGFI